jgi:tRNA modification GTPase
MTGLRNDSGDQSHDDQQYNQGEPGVTASERERRPPAPSEFDTMREAGDGEHREPGAPRRDEHTVRAFVSCLTSQGRGAIAVLRVWGPRAIEIVDVVFRPHRGARLAETPWGHLRLGRIGGGLGDEVVVVALGGEPPAVEIQCHGGSAAVALVVEALQSAGATVADAAQTAEQLAVDAIARDALADLTRAPTVRTAEILLHQAQGALRSELTRLVQSITGSTECGLAEIETLLVRAEIGLRLLDGWRVVIAGRPNVGKSRLFNALVGFGRAIVDPTAGTTRDVVSQKVAFAGWPVDLADTAGLRESSDPVERLGIERSRREQQHADLVVLVLDRSVPLELSDRELIATNPAAILAANKSDLPAAWHADDLALASRVIVTVSAEKGDGLSDLIAVIGERLVPEPPPAGVAVPFRAEQVDRLRRIRDRLLSSDRTGAAHEVAEMIHGRDWGEL